MKARWFLAAWFVIGAWVSFSAEALKLGGSVALPEVSGRFDHFAFDAAGGRLFVAALGNDTVEAIDVAAKKRVTTIRGLRKPQGVVFIADKNQIGVAAGEDGAFKVFRGADFELVSSIEKLDDADNVRINAACDRIFVGYGDGALAVVDAASLKLASEIKIAGHPESFQLEKNGPRIFVNVPGVKEVAVVDRDKGKAVKSWPMTKFQSNFPMALDEANHRLFIGCRRPPRLLILDSENGKEIADVEISGDTDDLFYDAKRQRAYVSCGEGFVDVIDCAPHQPLKRVAKIPTRSGARTSFYSAERSELYVAVPKRGGEAAEIRIYQASD